MLQSKARSEGQKRRPEARPGEPFTSALFWRIMGFESMQYIRRVARDVTVFSTVHLMRHRPEASRAEDRAE